MGTSRPALWCAGWPFNLRRLRAASTLRLDTGEQEVRSGRKVCHIAQEARGKRRERAEGAPPIFASTWMALVNIKSESFGARACGLRRPRWHFGQRAGGTTRAGGSSKGPAGAQKLKHSRAPFWLLAGPNSWPGASQTADRPTDCHCFVIEPLGPRRGSTLVERAREQALATTSKSMR